MSFPGRVMNGAVVLDTPLALPDGTAVRVEPDPSANIAGRKRYGEDQRTPQERLDALMADQGVEKTATYENLEGQGADLWDSDEEFDDFMAIIAATRAEKG